MASLNRAQIIGRLGKDPEMRSTASGVPVANFSVATSEAYTKNNQKVETTEWHRVTAWNKTGELAAKYLRKGSLVYVEGRIQTREYTDKAGHKSYATEIVAMNIQFLDSKPKAEGSAPAPQAPVTFSAADDDYLSQIPF